MSFADDILSKPRPNSVTTVKLPRRAASHPSPADWRDEIIYFFLPDRFSDGKESTRPLLDSTKASACRTPNWSWQKWYDSGGGRYQGGTIKGATTKLDYIKALGATTLWVGPIFKQRTHWDSYHGYAIQDFLDVDPRLGSREDVVKLVSEAHKRGLRVLLDIVFNHTGNNWIYANGEDQPKYKDWPDFYEKGQWRTRTDGRINNPATPDDAVWPEELQRDDYYTRAGEGDLGKGDIDDPHAEFRRTDFDGDRDINYDGTSALNDLARCYKYWIALTDCDGFRIDTLKHMDEETGRDFCGSIKEFATNLGKADFFLVGEVAGSDFDASRYLQVLGSNLNATLDIGESKTALRAVAKGFAAPSAYFNISNIWDDELGSHRNMGRRRVTVLDDHDHVTGEKLRFSTNAASDHQVVAGVAIQLFSLGIPCIYYGTEQAFAGPEQSEQRWLPEFGTTDRYLREAMFGPDHPRAPGLAGLPPATPDANSPGFGPFGTVGAHCFNSASAAYVRIAALADIRNHFPVLRYGRQYERQISNFNAPFAPAQPGELIAWSRILDDEEALCVVNGHGTQARGGDVVVDSALNSANPNNPTPQFTVVANSAQAAAGAAYSGAHPIGQTLPVKQRNGVSFVEIRNVQPSEVVVLMNQS
jgi:glycosidase